MTTEGGTQIWDLNTQTCYFDFQTSEDIYASGAGAESCESWTDTCETKMKVKKGKLVLEKNTCDKFPRPGKYALAGDNLVRKK